MLFSKFLKKLILVSLFVAVPAQTMPMSWPSFSGMKETVKKNKTVAMVAVGSLILTSLSALCFKSKKNAIAMGVCSCIATYLSKIYCDWKEEQRKAKIAQKIEKDNKEIASRCCICLFTDSEIGEELQEVRCDKVHPEKIHPSCFDKTLDASENKCPLCRARVPYFGFNQDGFNRERGQGLYWNLRELNRLVEGYRY